MTTRPASAALIWNPGSHARRRSPLYSSLKKAVRMALLVAALTCLGNLLLTALRTNGDSPGIGLTAGAARAEVLH